MPQTTAPQDASQLNSQNLAEVVAELSAPAGAAPQQSWPGLPRLLGRLSTEMHKVHGE